MISKESLIENVLIGTAVGDAFGAGVEFQDRDWIRANVDFTKFVNARSLIKVPNEQKDLFVKNYQAWDYTDDTEMTIGLIKALMSLKAFSCDLLVDSWKEEYLKGKKEKGFGRNGHGSMAWFYSGEKTIEEIRSFQKNRTNPGNAPAMRSVPLAFVEPSKINAYAKINAEATHPNIAAILSSQAIAQAAKFLLIEKGNPQDLFRYCYNNVSFNESYYSYLTKVNDLPNYAALQEEDYELLCGTQPIKEPYFLPGIKGLPSDSKYTTGAVLYILKHSKNAFDALQKSIYLGGDVDSVASICTGIYAGIFGIESLPRYMIEEVEGSRYLQKLANEFGKAYLALE